MFPAAGGRRLLGHYVTKGPGIKPIRPEYVAAVLSELADDAAVFTVDTGTPCIWAARHIDYGRDRRMFGSFTWASMANASPNAFGAALSFPGAAGHRPMRRRRLHHARAGRPADPGPA
jgi:pyruvate dehydrogenase (quinone)